MRFDTTKIDFDRTTFIWSDSALRVAAELDVEVDQLITRLQGIDGSNVSVYPDGSIQFEGIEAFETFESIAGDRIRNYAVGCSTFSRRRSTAIPLGGSWFNGLEPFAKDRRYALWLWGDFTAKNDGGHLVIDTCSEWQSNAYPQCPIDDLLITFVLHRKLTKRMRSAFAILLGRWLTETRTLGGAVVPIDGGATFFDRVVQLHVNADKSRQRAFNWLILSLIEFCKTNLVLRVCFTEHADAYTSIDEHYGLVQQIPSRLRIDA